MSEQTSGTRCSTSGVSPSRYAVIEARVVMADWTPPFGTVRPSFLVGGVPVLNVIDHRRPPIASAATFTVNVVPRPCRLAETFPMVLMSGRPGDPPFDWSTGVDPELADT